ncbi:PDR/VanB family oxidoreductase [Paracoccus aminophilus]|uniref:Ferredoxin n=1 Tax=Paracoccus aminophilus JCM 7686 TaxID=1367847 RepID=S5Y1P3_PARAH|nr:PDR/VanB family oxidoreductase [Paracoccus aminophilus]AGT11402.1 ferredoxin [Paracoccus aminophilus JCM 7686]
MSGAPRIHARVAEVIPVNALIKTFRFVPLDGGPVPPFSGGSHIVVEMNDNGTRRLNPYSLMSDPSDTSGYSISVRRDDFGRGGSLFMHNHVEPGMEMTISYPVNLFPEDARAKKHLLIAGGIGITPFIAQMAQMDAQNANFELHYAVQSRSLGQFGDELKRSYDNRVHLYYDDEGIFIDIPKLLRGQPLGTHVYTCGPKGMINAVHDLAEKAGWPKGAVHSEEFLAPPVGEPFEVELARSGKTITVGAVQSLLEAMEANGVDAPYLCRGGACGQCECDVLALEGDIEHNDHWLTPEQRASGKKIMPCVSRFSGERLVLDL